MRPSIKRKVRDTVKAESGPEIVLERKGGAFTFDGDVKDEKKSNTKEQEAEWKKPRNPATGRWTWMSLEELQGISMKLSGMRRVRKSNATSAIRVFTGGMANTQ